MRRDPHRRRVTYDKNIIIYSPREALLILSLLGLLKLKVYHTQIRLLWMGCFQGANLKSLQTQEVNGMVCDCILDKTRILLPIKTLLRSQVFMQDEYSRLADVCADELGLMPSLK